MTKDKLIQKWLKDDLNPQELEAFQALDDYPSLMRLTKSLKQFKAPEFENQLVFEEVLNKTQKKPTPKTRTNRLKFVLRIAALLALSFSFYYYTTTLDTNISTLTAEKTAIKLPDHSEVSLNASTKITFNKKDWKTHRELALNGEAYFKVEKGSQFKVKTPTGNITVLGTQFLVKYRENLFEVVCYEGSVKVSTSLKTMTLKPGDQFLMIDGKFIAQEKDKSSEPSWLHNESQFNSMPYQFVLSELERQYQLTIDSKNIDTDLFFTGRFTHDNLDLALKAITLPLNIEYIKENGLIILHDK